MRRFWLIMAVAVLIQLCGCGLSGINEEIEADGNIVKLNYVPDLNYYKKPQSPSLITDRLGYEPSARKMVYLIREEADTDFYIYNVDTGDCVFRGVMSKMDMAGDELQHLYIGDFSDLNIAGNYRVLQNDVGYSDQFTIENDLYINLYKSTYSKIATASYSRTSDLIFVLSNLMMTNEIYGESYIDQAFVNSSVEKLIKCQDAASGAVYDRLVENEGEPGMESLATTAEFAGLMAQYYIINSNEPDELAKEALKAADKAYMYMDPYKENVYIDSYYFASAQLYRATGQYKYRNAIAWYDQMKESGADVSPYDYTLSGNVAYLKSNVKVDYNRCEEIMNSYLNDMVRLSEISDKQHFYVQSDIEELTQDEILNNMMELGLVAYVVSGREYSSIQANYIHYLLGANAGRRDYINEGEDGMPLGEDILELSKLIFILGNNYEV